MWKPEERIKFQTSPGSWPSKQEALSSRLFSPIKYNNLSLAHRTWIPAMVPWRATENGEVTDAVVEWYERFAHGKPGALVVEATGVRDIPSGPLLRIGDDRYIEGLKRIVDAVKIASNGHTKIFIQLIDFLNIRRRPTKNKYFNRFLDVTEDHKKTLGDTLMTEKTARAQLVALGDDALEQVLTPREFESYSKGYRERVTDMHLPHVCELPLTLPPLFAEAALRAKEAGFDGVELHYAHAYTMASFLSKLNNRPDEYGGNKESRMRLPLEVFKAVRQTVGDSFTVGCRMLTDDCVAGGSKLEDAVYFAEAFASAGMDFISTSRGGKFEDAAVPKEGQAVYPYTGQSGYECMPHYISDTKGPFGRNAGPVAEVRQALRQKGFNTPIVIAGGIHGFNQAETMLRECSADIIGLARQSLADPDWFEKVRTGCGNEVNVCKYTNYCEGLDQKHKTVTCQLWDRVGIDEEGTPLTRDGKRRLTAPTWNSQD